MKYVYRLLNTMGSEFLLEALPIKSKLWSFSVTVELWNVHVEYILNVNILQVASSEEQKSDFTHLTALPPTCLYQHTQTPGLETQTDPVHNT